jgi:hypothetical protein
MWNQNLDQRDKYIPAQWANDSRFEVLLCGRVMVQPNRVASDVATEEALSGRKPELARAVVAFKLGAGRSVKTRPNVVLVQELPSGHGWIRLLGERKWLMMSMPIYLGIGEATNQSRAVGRRSFLLYAGHSHQHHPESSPVVCLCRSN